VNLWLPNPTNIYETKHLATETRKLFWKSEIQGQALPQKSKHGFLIASIVATEQEVAEELGSVLHSPVRLSFSTTDRSLLRASLAREAVFGLPSRSWNRPLLSSTLHSAFS
jgi:hypothetical protein